MPCVVAVVIDAAAGNVSFYEGTTLTHSEKLPTNITDCAGGDLEVGGGEIGLAQLRFYLRGQMAVSYGRAADIRRNQRIMAARTGIS